MSSTTEISSSNIQLILDALHDYAKQTGTDLTQNPFTDQLQSCRSPQAILGLLEEKSKAFKEYRDGNRSLIKWLDPVVHVLHVFAGVLGRATSLVPFQPANAIVCGVDVLLVTAIRVGGSYDALVDLFECVGNFLKRLHIYTETPLNFAMIDIIVKILVEVLSVLALATKQIKQGRFKKFAKKLLGEKEIEAVLQRMDRLTQDEARITIAQMFEVVHGLVNNVKVVMDNGKASTDHMWQALVTMQETTIEINKMKRDQLQRDIRIWLSPPDPSTNHNIARTAHHDGTAAWFIQGDTFQKWKTTGLLLWIHGKPGSGKSVLCSSIIQDVKARYDSGLALLGYFYFDFRDIAKQDARGLLTSLLGQLSAKSDSCNNILSQLYSQHNEGSHQPDDQSLTECLKKMLKLPGLPDVYIIVDGLDESPNTSGFPTARERVLDLVDELVQLGLPNLRICVTSRLETDIGTVLKPLTPFHVSLHDESGQGQDILNYISAVVHSDRRMQRWSAEDKQLVIDVLSARAGGMFRWVFCQLETLRRSPPAAITAAIWRSLDELPEGLDATYERTLLRIEKEKREYAHRLFQCLLVAIRPLHVEELANVFAIQFDANKLPQYHEDCCPEDLNTVLSACSSLVAIVNVDGSPIIQFSHFSVREFLTSRRLADAGQNLSRYHVSLRSAHTILAQASLSILLYLDDQVDRKSMEKFPFANYAARHWIDHGRFENVVENIQNMLERLFDKYKPYFATWVWIYDIDHPFREHMFTQHPTLPGATPLYYATLCGFRSLIEHLLVTDSGDINSKGGYYDTCLHAGLAKGTVDIALLLLDHGADVNSPDELTWSPLHVASDSGRRDHVEFLLEHHADANIRDRKGSTPLYLASARGELEIVHALLRHGADADCHCNDGLTALHAASKSGSLAVVQELLRHGADIDVQDDRLWTILHAASSFGHLSVVEFLIEWGADIDTKTQEGETALHLGCGSDGSFEVARFLIDHGADPNSQDITGDTPLHKASVNGHLDIIRLLLDLKSNIDVRGEYQSTALIQASCNGMLEASCLLIENGADVNSAADGGWTALHFASARGHSDILVLLLDHGADINRQAEGLLTPLHFASVSGQLDVTKLLIERGAAIDSRDVSQEMPLHCAAVMGELEIARLLIRCGSNLNAEDGDGRTPLHTAAQNGHLDIVELLVESGGDVNVRNNNNKTALDLALDYGKLKIARFLAERTGNANSLRCIEDADALSREQGTSLFSALVSEDLDLLQSLVDGGADVNGRDVYGRSPLAVASEDGWLEVAKLFVKHGARVDSQDNNGWTPLHCASRFEHLEVARLLLDHGADVNAKPLDLWTSLHYASANGHRNIVKLLLDRGADVHVLNDEGRTPSQEASRNGRQGIVKLLAEYGRDRM